MLYQSHHLGLQRKGWGMLQKLYLHSDVDPIKYSFLNKIYSNIDAQMLKINHDIVTLLWYPLHILYSF